MKILIIGGPRHGEWLDTLDGVRMWVDLRNAASHVIRKVTSNITDVKTGEVLEAYVLNLAVHPDLTGPYEVQQAGAALQILAVNEFSRTHGERQEIPVEPAAVDRG